MIIDVRHESPRYKTYRAERTRSMFNVTDTQGAVVQVKANLEIDDLDWGLGLVVGPSGSGKTTIGNAIWGADKLYMPGTAEWPADMPIIEAIAPGDDYDAVTGALSSVGLGDVPAWMRPYQVLSTGEKFRADLARIVSERPEAVVVDEFTSVVDRQIAKVGASAFGKAWKRTGGQAVMLSCHYDILEWLQPDWVYDTSTHEFRVTKECLRRPEIRVDIHDTAWNYWPLFKPHHYLDSGPMPFGTAYTAFVKGEPVSYTHLTLPTKA